MIERHDALPVHIPWQRLAHVERVFRQLATVVSQHPPVRRVAKRLVHLDRQRVGRTHKQINKVGIVLLHAADIFKSLHEGGRQAKAAVLGRHGDSRNVSVPLETALAFGLAEAVAHDFVIRGTRGKKGFRPLAHVRHVKAEIVGFRQDVEVDIVEDQKIVQSELSNGCHDTKIL